MPDQPAPDFEEARKTSQEVLDFYSRGIPGAMDAGAPRRLALAAREDDPLAGANCGLCGATADNFHVSDELWERVGLGPVQACFKCFRIAAWKVGVRPEPAWEIHLPATESAQAEEER